MADGKADITMGALMLKQRPSEWEKHLDRLHFYTAGMLLFATRKPIPIVTYNQYIKGFSIDVWIATLCTLFILGAMFKITYYYHANVFRSDRLGPLTHRFDFLLLTIASFTEPDPLPWFPKWSSGKLLVLIWSTLSTFMLFFYTSNLRAKLAAVRTEKPIDSAMDAVERGKPIFLHYGLHGYLLSGA